MSFCAGNRPEGTQHLYPPALAEGEGTPTMVAPTKGRDKIVGVVAPLWGYWCVAVVPPG